MLATVSSVRDLRAALLPWREAGETVGLVPTMGALHRGHLALVREAQRRAGRVVVSIFRRWCRVDCNNPARQAFDEIDAHLDVVKLPIQSVFGKKLLVRPTFYELTLVENKDEVCVSDR